MGNFDDKVKDKFSHLKEGEVILIENIRYFKEETEDDDNFSKKLGSLGDIYINHLRDLDAAEDCYRRILAVEPDNVQGLHNLCVVMVERGQLASARSCLQQAHALAPHEDYIRKHLDIVETKIQETTKKDNVAEK